jgi:hypothetical protein
MAGDSPNNSAVSAGGRREPADATTDGSGDRNNVTGAAIDALGSRDNVTGTLIGRTVPVDLITSFRGAES